ncbi:ABC transporter ATP-binding protein, partial [Clavibacter lycopersici]
RPSLEDVYLGLLAEAGAAVPSAAPVAGRSAAEEVAA